MKKNIINFIKKRKVFWVVLFLSLLFFLATASFNYLTKDFSKDPVNHPDFVKWTSPDENANYVFTKLYAQTGSISLFEQYNLYTKDVMHPRSFRSDAGELKPVSFLGIILIYGIVAKIFGYKIIPFLTPAIAALGILFFYLLVKRLFSKSTALIAAFLLAAFPVYIYYSVRSMFHNVLFIVLIIMGLYFLMLWPQRIKKEKRKKFFSFHFSWRVFLWPALAGLSFGLAIITRSSELIWVLPLLGLVWIFNIRRAGIVKLIVFVAFLLVAVSPAFYYNQILYGNMFFGGYAEMNSSLVSLKQAGTTIINSTLRVNLSPVAQAWQKIKNTVFYFGYQPDKSYEMFKVYFVQMFAWFFWPALLGLLAFFSYPKQIKLRHVVYLLAYLSVSLILVVYYGSWDFHDNPDPNAATIGNSYTRYWLPVYLGILPFMAYLIKRLTAIICQLPRRLWQRSGQIAMHFNKRFRISFCRQSLRAVVYIFVFFYAINFVLAGSNEGLVYLYQNSRSEQKQWQEVLNLTESNSVIITRYHDKLFFPERKVVVGLFDDTAMVAIYSHLARLLPVYYYNFNLAEKDIDYLNRRRLGEAGLNIREIKRVTPDFTLYRLLPVEALELSTTSSTKDTVL